VAGGAAQPGRGVRLDDAVRSVGRALRGYDLSFDAVVGRTDRGGEGNVLGQLPGSQRFAVGWSVRRREAVALGRRLHADLDEHQRQHPGHATRGRNNLPASASANADAGATNPRADPGTEPHSRTDQVERLSPVRSDARAGCGRNAHGDH
jgi:hypothetical protein